MKRILLMSVAAAVLGTSVHAQVTTATYRWNFNQTNINSSNYVFQTIADGTVPEPSGTPPRGTLVSLSGTGAGTNLLGAPGSGVSSGLYPNIPFDRALLSPGTYNANSLITRTPNDSYSITNLSVISNFTVTCWAKSDLPGGFIAGQFPRIFTVGQNGLDQGFNNISVLFFNAGDLQLKVHNAGANGISTSTTPLAGAATNWIFIAITYDGSADTTVELSNTVFYVGNRSDSFLSPVLAPGVSIIPLNYNLTSLNSGVLGSANSPGWINFDPAVVSGDGNFGITNVYVAIGNRYNGNNNANGGGNRAFTGRFDDIRFFPNQVLTVDQVEAVRTNAPPKAGEPLVVVEQPQSQIRFEGQAIQFSVVATEAANRTYQWSRIAPGGATTNVVSTGATPFYTTPALTLADNGAKYFVRVTSSDPASGSVRSSNATVMVVSAANTVNVPGMLKFEYYNNISGGTVADLLAAPNYPSAPDSVLYLPSFDTRTVFPDDAHFNYGGRISGWITPTVTTNYVFFLRAGDQATLELSTDADPINLTQIAADTRGGQQVFYGPESTTPASTEVVSTPMALVAGSNYAVRVLFKAGSGADLAQVAWKTDSGANDLPFNVEDLADRQLPIPAAHLSAVAPANGTVSITQPPSGGSVPAHSYFTLTVGASGSSSPMVVQWQKDGANIPRATGASYTTPPLTATAQYRAVVSIPGAVTNSSAATVTVTADNVPPQVASATSEDTMHSVVVQFSEPVDAITALNTNNYSIPGLSVIGAAFAVDTNLVDNPPSDAVRLRTSRQSDNTAYTVTVSNVKDTANNTIAAGNTAGFHSYVLIPGFAKESYFENQTVNPGVYPDDLTVSWLLGNSLKFLNDAADTIVYPASLAFSPVGNNAIRTALGGFNIGSYPPLFGTRLKTYITPTNTGNYIFYISADDTAALWLSTDDDPANKHLIAYQQSPDGFQGNWAGNSALNLNTSSATFDTNSASALVAGATPWPDGNTITLTAGRRYYLEADHRENSTFASFCAVNWDDATGIAPANGTLLTGNLIGWTFPASQITSFGRNGSNVEISWTSVGDVDKGFLGFPGLLDGSITESYPTADLQSAPAVTGPWNSLTNASPATIPATNSLQFFRVGQ